jgi:mRNA-degrading endonuclease toxin of MazEF toxin-antitoxin module
MSRRIQISSCYMHITSLDHQATLSLWEINVLQRRIGRLSAEEITQLDEALRLHLEL